MMRFSEGEKGKFFIFMKKTILILIILFFSNIAYAGYARIISLAPSITSELYDLDSEESLIGVTSYCKAPGKEIVGTLLDINLEKVVSLKPDLIVATSEWNNTSVIDKLKRLNLNVVVFGRQDNFNYVCNDFLKLADLVDKKPQAEKLIENIKKEVFAISLRSQSISRKKVLWQVNARPLITIGKIALASDLLKFVGAVNLFSDINMPYSRVSYEEAVKRNPDIIILAGMDNVMQDEKDYWQKFKGVEAIKNNRIFILDPYKSCQPTPVKFLESLKIVDNLINPNHIYSSSEPLPKAEASREGEVDVLDSAPSAPRSNRKP